MIPWPRKSFTHSLIHSFTYSSTLLNSISCLAPWTLTIGGLGFGTPRRARHWAEDLSCGARDSSHSIGLSDGFKSECNSKRWPLARISWKGN